ncbi:MAG TPA: serine/threonine-protein kinase [Arthrobacter sp.]
MTTHRSATAEMVGGRYELGHMIGRGGMASVYSARDVKLHRDVALKLFALEPADPLDLKRQETEIDFLATLNHPGLVTLFDAGAETRTRGESQPYLAMELVDGKDLKDRLRHGPVTGNDLAVIGEGVAAALAYVHAKGIVHRDIKPANILLVQVRPGTLLQPKLSDFGLARSLDASRLTSAGMMLGTAAYLSPEQAMGADLGPASDIYSLGLVLLECLKGELEYTGSAVESAVARLQRAPVIPASVPSEWARLLRAMTAMDPLDRPDAAAVEASLRHALASPGFVPGPIAGTVRPAHRGTSRLRKAGRRLATGVLLVAVALFATAPALPAAAPAAPAVVDYPAVDGTVGDLLKQLQESVEP